MKKREYVLLDPAKRRDVIRALLHDLCRLPGDKPFVLSLEELQRPISDGQRKLWWVWMQILGDEVGDTKQGIYETVKHDLVSWMEGRGISDLTKDEMHALMEEVQLAASSMGWYLPSSMDDYYQTLEAITAERGKKM